MENNVSYRALTLSAIFKLFIKKLWILAIVGTVVAGAIVGLTFLDRNTRQMTWDGQVSMRAANNNLANDAVSVSKVAIDSAYKKMYSERAQELVTKSGKVIGINSFSDCVSVTHNEKNIKVVVKWHNKEDAVKLAQNVAYAICNELEAAERDQISTPTGARADHNRKATIIDAVKNGVFAGILCAAMAYVVLFLIYWLDRKVRAQDKIEEFFNIPVLGTVPTVDPEKLKNNDHYSEILSKKINCLPEEEN